jgi:hypothetical protein
LGKDEQETVGITLQ